MLKSDFHVHTSEDFLDEVVPYSTIELIDIAAKKGFKVIAVACHGKVHYVKKEVEYAKKKGILLIPAAEIYVGKKHVLVLGLTGLKEEYTYAELAKLKKKGAVIIAPHPLYVGNCCLHEDLVKHIDLFDAIEYSHFYTGGFTNMFNRKAAEVAKKYNKPLVGNSDAHFMYQFDRTYSLVDAKPTIKSVLDAIRKGRVKVVTRPLPMHYYIRHVFHLLGCVFKNIIYQRKL